MDYHLVATTVFTPIEYGACGYSEEDAIKKFGEENIDIFHSTFKPLEWSYYEEHLSDSCYSKLVVNKKDNNRVVGLHFLGPHAGEVT
jgi:thioredoxin reductase (NADPH)